VAEPTDAQDPATEAGADPQPGDADHLSEYSTQTGDTAAAALREALCTWFGTPVKTAERI